MNQAPLIDLSPVSVLCVDDDAVMRSVIRAALQNRGCRDVVQAHGGEDALDLCAGRDFDLVICDLQMRPMNGLDFLRELASTGLSTGWPVIMLSAETDPATIQEARDLGIAAFLGKPVSVQTLIEQVGTVLRQHGKVSDAAPDGEFLEAAERHHARLIAALANAETVAGSLSFRARDAAGVAQGMRNVLDNIDEHAGALGYGLVTILAGRAVDLTMAMARNPAVASRGHAAASRTLMVLITAMKRVAQNRMTGDGGDAGTKLLEKIDGIVDPVRAAFG